jgi:hypothetical protein
MEALTSPIATLNLSSLLSQPHCYCSTAAPVASPFLSIPVGKASAACHWSPLLWLVTRRSHYSSPPQQVLAAILAVAPHAVVQPCQLSSIPAHCLPSGLSPAVVAARTQHEDSLFLPTPVTHSGSARCYSCCRFISCCCCTCQPSPYTPLLHSSGALPSFRLSPGCSLCLVTSPASLPPLWDGGILFLRTLCCCCCKISGLHSETSIFRSLPKIAPVVLPLLQACGLSLPHLSPHYLFMLHHSTRLSPGRRCVHLRASVSSSAEAPKAGT